MSTPPTWDDMMREKERRDCLNFYLFERRRIEVQHERARAEALARFAAARSTIKYYWRTASSPSLADHLRMEYRFASINWVFVTFISAIKLWWWSIPKNRRHYINWQVSPYQRHTWKQRLYFSFLERWRNRK